MNVKVKSLSHVRFFVTPWTVAYQAPLSIGFSRQEYWSGLHYTVEVTNRLKGLDLIDRVPEELWMKVCDIVQEAGIKTIPKEKKCKKVKWLCDEALQIPEKRRKAKGEGEKERYTHLNAEFQRIARI